MSESQSFSSPSASLQDRVRAELEATRSDFLALLATGGPFHGEYRTIEIILRSYRAHFQEHAAEIRQSLSRP